MKRVLSLLLSAILLLSCMSFTTGSASAASKPVPGYYVVGTFNSWTIDRAYRMETANFDSHYALYQTPLRVGDELKIVWSEDGLSKSVWYPSGVDNNYIVTEGSEYYNIEVAPDYDGVGDGWYEGCIKAQPCPPPVDDPTEPEHIDYTKRLWETGALPTAEDIEEAANEQHHSQTYFCADEITVCNAYRFDCTPAYVVDYYVNGGGVYCCVILNERFGDYLFYSSSSYEPSIFADNKLTTLTRAYQEGVLTDEMLAELAESDYTYDGHCRIITRYIPGDADGDGAVNIIDATYVQRYDVDIIGDYDLYKPLADVDGDNDVNIIDATLIQRYDVGISNLDGSPIR